MPRLVRDGSLRVGDRTVQVTSVNKPFFPDAGLVKGDLLAYYRDVAEVMLPHIAGRPLRSLDREQLAKPIAARDG